MCGSAGRGDANRGWLAGIVTTSSPARVVKGLAEIPWAASPLETFGNYRVTEGYEAVINRAAFRPGPLRDCRTRPSGPARRIAALY